MGRLLDLIMGSDSPFKKTDEKRVEYPSSQSIHIIETIVILQQLKEAFVELPPIQGLHRYPMT